MRYTLAFCLSLASVALALGQSPQPSETSATEPGVASEWDARKLIDALTAQAQHLKPIIDQVQPAAWVSKGASETYVAQWNSAQAQLKYLIASSDAFSRQPERLPLGLDTYFRMQAVDSVLASLTEGVRKYQNPALASIMQDLATQKEQEFQVADREAQRCRAALLRQPAPPKTKKVSQP